MSNFRKWIDEIADEQELDLIVFDDLDDAIIGICQIHSLSLRVAYDYNKIISILMTDWKMAREEAEEYFEFNIASAWVGPETPAILYLANDDNLL